MIQYAKQVDRLCVVRDRRFPRQNLLSLSFNFSNSFDTSLLSGNQVQAGKEIVENFETANRHPHENVWAMYY